MRKKVNRESFEISYETPGTKHPTYVTLRHKEWHGNFCPVCLSREPLFWDQILGLYRRKCIKGHSVEVSPEVARKLLKEGVGFFWYKT